VRKEQQELLRQKVASDVLAQDPREVPSGLRRWAEERARSRVDWRGELSAELRRAVAAVAGASDYSYARPSRRAAAVPSVVLPSLRKPVAEVAVVCDTSGSVSAEMLGIALAEVDGVLRAIGTRHVRVLACDAAVQAVTRVRRSQDVVLIGGGDTDMGAGLAAAVDHRPRPQIVVVLTDGWSPWPDEAPPRVTTIVGLLPDIGEPPAPPAWARTIRIPAPDG
jgi:predicted metal-dependent peptidase